jgi:UDP-N-acetyl-D-glucosamine dehydrogenase
MGQRFAERSAPVFKADAARFDWNCAIQGDDKMADVSAATPLVQMATTWQSRVDDRALIVGVVGLGYVGLPLSEAFIKKGGLKVIGYDVDTAKVDALKAGQSYIRHIPDDRIGLMVKSGRFDATTDMSRLPEADALLICVPTPLNQYREPDLTIVEKTCETISKHLRLGQLVVLESTTYPGTSAEVMIPILERGSGLKAHIDFAIAYSPEREDPGNIQFDTSKIPKVVGADTAPERDMALSMYATITQTVPVRDLKTAEAVKLTENIFRLINIALVNELKTVFAGMDIDVWEVIEAAKTKPFGFMPFYPGPGLGGHCIPIDPFYLTWKAREYGENTRFIELAGDVVSKLPKLVVEGLSRAMSDKLGRAMKDSRVLVLGLAYKKDIDDMRESPSLILIDLLRERGAHVDYHDPHIPVAPHTREHPEVAGMVSVAMTAENIGSYDAVLISTDHSAVDYGTLVKHARLIVDTRNALGKFASPNIVKA